MGRARGTRPGRTEGFCTKCGHPYSFVPKLRRGDVVHGQYEVVGCLAHGGLGWIYLAVDRAVADRWVVLKGLLDTGDEDALAVALAERRFLAEIEHPNIVWIYNFVEHLDQRTGSLDGYIVMEYVGGKSLKQLANERRGPDGRRDPLPVERACAYGIEALEALGHLHSRNLLYCDFKIDNAIQQGDQLKLIDMGAVRRMGDEDSALYGTVGYQAPEVAERGPSVASNLYTVARTLAVLTFDFQGYTTVFADSFPDPGHIEVFRRYESFYRLLTRATDPDPERRFASAQEMADQLTGVLREVIALQTGRPRPALCTLFGAETRVVDTQVFPDSAEPDGLGARLGAGRGRRARLVAAASRTPLGRAGPAAAGPAVTGPAVAGGPGAVAGARTGAGRRARPARCTESTHAPPRAGTAFGDGRAGCGRRGSAARRRRGRHGLGGGRRAARGRRRGRGRSGDGSPTQCCSAAAWTSAGCASVWNAHIGHSPGSRSGARKGSNGWSRPTGSAPGRGCDRCRRSIGCQPARAVRSRLTRRTTSAARAAPVSTPRGRRRLARGGSPGAGRRGRRPGPRCRRRPRAARGTDAGAPSAPPPSPGSTSPPDTRHRQAR